MLYFDQGLIYIDYMMEWGCISQGCYPKVIEMSSQGQGKVKTAENVLLLLLFLQLCSR